MPTWDVREFCAGLLLIALGGFFAGYAAMNLRLGTVASMGPGMAPAVLGSVLVVIGLVMSTAAVFRAGSGVSFDRRVTLVVLASILAFAFLISIAGLVPAVVAQVLIVSRADAKLSLSVALLLAGALSVSVLGIFKYGLGVPLTVIVWPW